ncbi:MAG: site-specific integrase [Actinomycetota bacterium]|nr:site-specific integrase [Actinomycetota bacterium]
MLTLAAYAGLRPGEIASLDWGDLRRETDGTFLRVRSGRTGGHDRRVQLDPVVMRALRGYRIGSSGAVFPGRKGGRLDPKSVSRAGSRFIARHGLGVTMNDLRCGRVDPPPPGHRPTVNELGLLNRR